jgi:hypothetical protein
LLIAPPSASAHPFASKKQAISAECQFTDVAENHTSKKTEQINVPCSTDSRTGHRVVHRIVLIERRRGWNYSSPIQSMLRRLRPVHVVLWAAVSVGPKRSLKKKNHGNPKRENGILAKLASDTNYLLYSVI